ncbi:AAA family ATPase [Paenibacillus sp. GCM10012306]|uniref:AAA family ATPase n=1 Tax=Paenibacillus sp. GCM10012306 TaxID=3317342 RepID=UPI0036161D44
MKKVFLLMAYSGAGKTKIAKRLEDYGYNVLQPYTTRQPCSEDEWGHMFTTIKEYENFKKNNDIVAYSLFEGNHYFNTKEQMYEADIYAVDPDGIEDLKRNIEDIEFVTIYIKVDKKTRLRRMQERGDNFDKILAKVTTDGIKFRNKKFDYKVVNYDFQKAVDIIDFIIKTESRDSLNKSKEVKSYVSY